MLHHVEITVVVLHLVGWNQASDLAIEETLAFIDSLHQRLTLLEGRQRLLEIIHLRLLYRLLLLEDILDHRRAKHWLLILHRKQVLKISALQVSELIEVHLRILVFERNWLENTRWLLQVQGLVVEVSHRVVVILAETGDGHVVPVQGWQVGRIVHVGSPEVRDARKLLEHILVVRRKEHIDVILVDIRVELTTFRIRIGVLEAEVAVEERRLGLRLLDHAVSRHQVGLVLQVVL